MAERETLTVILGLVLLGHVGLGIAYLIAAFTGVVLLWTIIILSLVLCSAAFAIVTRRRWMVTLVLMVELVGGVGVARFGGADPTASLLLIAVMASGAFLLVGAVALPLPWRTRRMPDAGGPVLGSFLLRWASIIILGAGTALLLSRFRLVFLPARNLVMVVLVTAGIALWAALVLFNTEPDPEPEDLEARLLAERGSLHEERRTLRPGGR